MYKSGFYASNYYASKYYGPRGTVEAESDIYVGGVDHSSRLELIRREDDDIAIAVAIAFLEINQ